MGSEDAGMKPKGIVEDMEHCVICGRPAQLHHIFFGTANRRKSDRYHLLIPLCMDHHTGERSPHQNREIDLAIKVWGQQFFEENCGTREDFIREFGRTYL